jgi:hypothetical protein
MPDPTLERDAVSTVRATAVMEGIEGYGTGRLEVRVRVPLQTNFGQAEFFLG